jgi:catechol 2,3-dioxygenase-like lactoylglutathione lyase family enzyme
MAAVKESNDKARLVGINHVALEVGSIDEALSFYGQLFELSLRGRSGKMAFIDIGDQFINLSESRTRVPTKNAILASWWTIRRRSDGGSSKPVSRPCRDEG